MEKSNNRQKSCFTCKHMTISTPWRCGNQQAIDHRGTNEPNVIHCRYWEVDIDFITPIDTKKDDKPIARLG
jgi:hypothetical protein